MTQGRMAERLTEIAQELRELAGSDDGYESLPQAFADEQLRAFGSWVLDLLGFDDEGAYDHVAQARSLLTSIIATASPIDVEPDEPYRYEGDDIYDDDDVSF